MCGCMNVCEREREREIEMDATATCQGSLIPVAPKAANHHFATKFRFRFINRGSIVLDSIQHRRINDVIRSRQTLFSQTMCLSCNKYVCLIVKGRAAKNNISISI